MTFLHNLEGTDGLTTPLVTVVKNEGAQFSQDCRLLAIIYLKNIVTRRWVQVIISWMLSVHMWNMILMSSN